MDDFYFINYEQENHLQTLTLSITLPMEINALSF